MIRKLLSSCLGPVLAAEARLRRRRLVIAVLSVGAVGCALFTALALFASWWSWPVLLGFFAVLCLASLIGHVLVDRGEQNLREIARRIEERHPDLRSALLAAMDQKPAEDGSLSFLQRKLLGEISEHAVKNRWVRQVSERRLLVAGWGQFLALVAFVASLWILLGEAPVGGPPEGAPPLAETPAEDPAVSVRVEPGEVELEKGSRLVVEATFSGPAPASATLVHRHAGGETRIPMQVGLDDRVFSSLLAKVDTDGSYRVEYGGDRSEDYPITVFELPRLSRADAVVTPPAYLGGDRKTIEDTAKITVMEGSVVEWRIRVNQPVAAGELFGDDGEILTLIPDPAESTLLTVSHEPLETKKYRLHLVDGEDRSNREPPWLTVNVRANTPPKLKVIFPGRDFEVSALQELPLEAEVWDDVEVLRSGLVYEQGENRVEIVLHDGPLAGEEKHSLETVIDIEKLGVRERDLITYHFWAEDRDKEGKVRRSASDQFFAEVRLFEEIVREGAAGGGAGGSPASGEAGELIRIQKDIVNAAWKLVRDHEAGKAFESIAEDVAVVRDSQDLVIGKTEGVLGEVEDPEMRDALEKAKQAMLRTVTELATTAENLDGGLLAPALGSAKEAYAELLRARARETQISMARDPSQGGASSQEQQRNLNLELEQKELKYEEQSVAEAPTQTPEQAENLAVLNRLKDLARRQEAIAEKIKELENQLQTANEEEKSEIERQLKRLQEEQRELLREMDDLAERMDSEENRADMAADREKLEETREKVQETAEKLESGDLADAANAATRAGEKLEEMKEEFREKTSRHFSGEMQALRDQTRTLSEQQKSLGEEVEQLASGEGEESLSPDRQKARGELAQKIAEQAERLSGVLESMRTLSEQAEATEPILSDALYEAVREAATGRIEESLEEARDMAFYNRSAQARSAEAAAARGIEELKDRVEKAAEKILGNESDALRLARGELDKLIEEAEAEAERLAGSEGTEEGRADDPTGSREGKPPGDEEGEKGLAEGEKEKGEGPTGSDGKEEGQAAEAREGQGEGKDKGESLAEKGKGKGKGDEQGEGKGKGEESPAAGQAESGKGKGRDPGQNAGEGRGGTPSDSRAEGVRDQGERVGRPLAAGGARGGGGALNKGGDDRDEGLPTGPLTGSRFFDEATEERRPGPITGEDYEKWADRLGQVEEMFPQEDLRNAAARVRDEARAMRIDYRRDELPPGAATIERRIVEPLLELRRRVSEELAKLNRENPVAPIDRDPVPSEFRDLVRRYYEELGAGN